MRQEEVDGKRFRSGWWHLAEADSRQIKIMQEATIILESDIGCVNLVRLDYRHDISLGRCLNQTTTLILVDTYSDNTKTCHHE